ncbi:MAG: transcriptional regulator [Oscillospiraceae bacterium]
MSNNRERLQLYIDLAAFLANCYGENVEVAVHDISDLDHSAIAIYNNHVSGRKMGAPIATHMLNVIREKKYLDRNYSVNVKNKLSNGKVLRSSTYFIKDDTGELIGALCINVDVSQYVELAGFFDNLAFGRCASDEAPAPQEPEEGKDAFPGTVDELIGSTIADFEEENGAVSTFTPEQKIEIITRLNEKGTFLFKGTVKKISAALGVSEPTVYRYLSIIHQKEDQQ